MLTTLVLVCSLGMTPDLAACDRASALYVLQLPGMVADPAVCALHGQAYLAETVLGRGLTADERVKVVCVHRRG